MPSGAGWDFHRLYRFKNANLLEFLSDSKAITQVNGAAYNVATEAYKGGVFSVNSNGGIVPSLVNFTSPGALSCSDWFSHHCSLIIEKKVRGLSCLGLF